MSLLRPSNTRHNVLSAVVRLAWVGACLPTWLIAQTTSDLAPPGIPTLPLNTAEVMVEVFFDPQVSCLRDWKVEPGPGCGFKLQQNWAAVDFHWASKPASGLVLRMWRDFDVDCTRFDKLVVGGTTARNSTLKVAAMTDKGERTKTFTETGAQEFILDLAGATRLTKITLELHSQAEGSGAGWFTWISLVDTDQLRLHLDQFEHFDAHWSKWIKPNDFVPEFKPAIAVFLKPGEIERLRSTALDYYLGRAEALKNELKQSPPEKRIQELAGERDDRPLYREARGYNKDRLVRGAEIAEAAIITRDKELLRLAARWAMSLAVCPKWGRDPLQYVAGCPWEVRAFNESYASEDMAKILDLAGEMFTVAGRNYLLRRLGLYATGWITYMTWKHEYIFECNQLAYFNQGRVSAYLAMEPYMPRVGKYLQIAMEDIQDSFKVVLEPDGGYLEGPSYFCATARRHCQTLDYYARARDLNVLGIVPEQLRRTGDYAQTVASTTRFDYLPICDCD
jgi:hypothetical protein